MSKFTFAFSLFAITLLTSCLKSEECKLAEQQVGMYKLEVKRYEKRIEDVQNKSEIIQDDLTENVFKRSDAEAMLGEARRLKDLACK